MLLDFINIRLWTLAVYPQIATLMSFILQVVGNQDGSFYDDVYTGHSCMCFIKT